MAKRIVIAGGSGLVGRALESHFQTQDAVVTVLSREESSGNRVHWDGETTDGWLAAADGCDVIINLAGDNLATGVWTAVKKERIRASRVHSVQALARAVGQMANPPDLFLQASAIGFYGDRGNEDLDESSAGGSGFLAETCKQWEEALAERKAAATRVVVMRLGVVLDPAGGMVKKLLTPFKAFAGGHLGDGHQWLSWIHIQDVVGAVDFFVQNDTLSGIYNLTSPHPATAREFAKSLGPVLGRPSWLHLPAFAVKTLFGDLAREMLLAGQKVKPQRLLEAGYRFQFADMRQALEDLL